jgi:hypothetical protein
LRKILLREAFALLSLAHRFAADIGDVNKGNLFRTIGSHGRFQRTPVDIIAKIAAGVG